LPVSEKTRLPMKYRIGFGSKWSSSILENYQETM